MRKKNEINERRFFFYLHRNSKTNAIFYVGRGTGSRHIDFKNGTRSPFWNNYVSKHGEPIAEIFKSNLTNEEAAKLETELIIKYGRRQFDKGGILVNLTLGGEGGMLGLIGDKNPNYGKKLSMETKMKISKAHKGKVISAEVRKRMGDAQRGKKMSPESIERTRQKLIGKDFTTPEQRKKSSEMCKARIGEKHPLFGKPRPEDVRIKISKGHKGKKLSLQTIEKCKKWHTENKMFAKKVIDFGEYRVYNTMGDLAKRYGVDINTVTKWLNGKTIYKRGQFAFL